MLTSGSVVITVPGSSLAVTTDTLTATYTPDSNSSSTYNGAIGTNTVTVTAATTPTFALSNGGNIDVEASAITGNGTFHDRRHAIERLYRRSQSHVRHHRDARTSPATC